MTQIIKTPKRMIEISYLLTGIQFQNLNIRNLSLFNPMRRTYDSDRYMSRSFASFSASIGFSQKRSMVE